MFRVLVIASLVGSYAVVHAQQKIESTGFSYTVEKLPGWAAPSLPAPSSVWSGRSPVRILELDTQVNLTDASPVRFFRLRGVALEGSAVADVSQLRITFNPAYETLALHEVNVTRAGKKTDRLGAIKLDLLQREKELERSIYAGVVTAFAALPDIRVDDVLEYAYSIRGANPVFNGQYSANFVLNWTTPIDTLRVRVEHPAQIPLRTRLVGVDQSLSVTEKGRNRLIELVRNGLTPVKPEDRAPPWALAFPELQVSHFADWSEVNRWATEHYQLTGPLPPELIRVAEEVRAASKSEPEMVSRVLTFVQNEIRYFAVATGISSHKPSPPADTLARRYGDCKDKTMLTVALLRHLGIHAKPALVSLSRRQQVENWLPTPLAFDHVIVQVSLQGKMYWLDPTRSYQGRSLEQRGLTQYGRALVVDPEQAGLVQVASPPGYREGLEVTERFSIRTYTGPIDLTIVTRARGGDAESLRAALAAQTRDTVATEFEDSYRRRYPKLRRSAPMALDDDMERNELSITEKFEVKDLFTYQLGRVEARIYANLLGSLLRSPDVVSRTLPVALPYPARRSQRFEFELPLDSRFTGTQPVEIALPQLAFSYRSQQSGRTVSFDFEVQTRRDHVTTSELPEFLGRTSKVFDELQRTMQFLAYDRQSVERSYQAATRSVQRDLTELPAWTRRNLFTALWTRLAVEHAIASNLLEGEALATAWSEVAQQRDYWGERDKGLEAAERALKAWPDSPRAFLARGGLLLHNGSFEAARLDLERALALNPDVGKYALAQALYYLEKYPEAVDALTAEARRFTGPPQTYRLLWIHLAAKRAGLDAARELARSGYTSSRAEWPGPILSFLLGDTTEDRLLALARADAAESLPRLCETWFFIGQHRLLTGNSAGAHVAFREVLRTEIRPADEYIFAGHELKRLKK